jgi:gas vesicle protein
MLYRNTAGDVDEMRKQAAQIQSLKTRDKFEQRVKESVSRVQQKRSAEYQALQQHIAEEAAAEKARTEGKHAAAREAAINALAERFKR